MSQCSGDYWREKTNLDLRAELINHPDVELDIRNADNDSRRQQEDVRYFIDNGYDLIILAPNESEPLVGVVREAKAKVFLWSLSTAASTAKILQHIWKWTTMPSGTEWLSMLPPSVINP